MRYLILYQSLKCITGCEGNQIFVSYMIPTIQIRLIIETNRQVFA